MTLPPEQLLSTEFALELVGLSKAYQTGAGETPVLQNYEGRLKRGEAVAIVGPSGAGKSTLLYLIGLLERPTSGTVRVGGVNVWSLSELEQANFRNRRIGFVFQDHHLLPQCTLLENVLIPTIAGQGAGDVEMQRARDLLTRVGLADRLDHRPSQLSGGERQRGAFCRALINQPELLLADEPTGNLDRKTAETVGTLLLELAAERKTTLLCVTHSLELAARFPTQWELGK